MGFYDDIEVATSAVTGGLVRVNNSVCVNPNYKIKVFDVVSIEMQEYVDLRASRVEAILEEYCSETNASIEVKREILGDAADFLRENAAIARLKREGFSTTRYLFYRNLLRSVVTRIASVKRKYPVSKTMRGGIAAYREALKKTTVGRPGDTAYSTGTQYSLGDLAVGVLYEKLHVWPAPSREDKRFTPSKIRRMIERAISDDVTGLSSSLAFSQDIFYKFNNIAIYLRRPRTIYEMFEVSSLPATNTYNPHVIQNFYLSRFEK